MDNTFKFDLAIKNNFEALEENIKQIVNALSNPKIPEDYKFFINIILFFSMSNYDISAIKKNIIKCQDIWERLLFCRLLAITIFEFVDDVHQLLGKEFRSKMTFLFNNNYDFEEINILGKKLSNFKKYINGGFKTIRHNTIGHRDHDAFKQYEIINAINYDDFINISDDAIKLITDYVRYFSSTMSKLPYVYSI